MTDTDSRFQEVKRMLLGIQLTILGIAVGGILGLELGGFMFGLGLILVVIGIFFTSVGYQGMQ